MSRLIQITLKVLNDPEDRGEWDADEDIAPIYIYQNYDDNPLDEELTEEMKEIADAIEKLLGAY